MIKTHKINSKVPYKSGTVLEDKKTKDRFMVYSSVDLKWLIGDDYKKEGYKNRYYVTMRFIGNFKELVTEKIQKEVKAETESEECPLTQ